MVSWNPIINKIIIENVLFGERKLRLRLQLSSLLLLYNVISFLIEIKNGGAILSILTVRLIGISIYVKT